MPGTKRTKPASSRGKKSVVNAKSDRYALLREVLRDAFAVVDMDGRLIESNEEFVRMVGYSAAELRGKTFYDLTPIAWHEKERKIIEDQVLPRGFSDIYEKEYLRKDGTVIPVELRTSLMRDAMHRPVGMWAIIRDLTPRKKIEERLAESEEKFAKAFHLSPDSVNINRIGDGVFIAVNQGFTRTTGYTAEEVIGRSSLPHEAGLWARAEDRERLVAGLRARGEVLDLEAPFRIKGGEIRLGLMSARVIQFGNEPCILSVTRDITERKKDEESLRTSEERMRAIIEGTPHLFFYTQDADAVTTYASPTVEAITGYPPEIWKQQRDWFITDAEMNLHAKEATRAHLRGETSVNPLIIEVRHREGHKILLEVYENAIVHNGAVVGLQGVAHDVTERKRAEEEIVRSLKEKEVLLKEIHHRVKNNLQIISSMLSMQSVEATEEAVRDALREAQSRIRSMALVHESLYGASDLGRVNLLLYASSLAANLSRSWMRPEIAVHIDGSSAFVGIDSAIPCGLILNELLTNAFKHAFTGRTSGEVKVSVLPEGDSQIEICVEDNGVGIREESKFTAPVSMGMNLVRDLVEQLSGTVTLDRTSGTRFQIRFPR